MEFEKKKCRFKSIGFARTTYFIPSFNRLHVIMREEVFSLICNGPPCNVCIYSWRVANHCLNCKHTKKLSILFHDNVKISEESGCWEMSWSVQFPNTTEPYSWESLKNSNYPYLWKSASILNFGVHEPLNLWPCVSWSTHWELCKFSTRMGSFYNNQACNSIGRNVYTGVRALLWVSWQFVDANS